MKGHLLRGLDGATVSIRVGLLPAILALAVATIAACGPSGAPAPTTAPAKPAPAPSPPPATEQSAAKPASKPTEGAAPKPAESPSGRPAFDEKAVADFYRNKTVRIIVGFDPGGAFDGYSRLLARHMARHLPGNPTIIVENRPGAASRLAANAVYNTEPKDGTVIASINQNLVMEQVLDPTGIEFDSAKFNWLGSAASSPGGCAVRVDTGISTIRDVMDGREVVIAADQPGSNAFDIPAVLNATLGTRSRSSPGTRG